jgi:hypothetical protein
MPIFTILQIYDNLPFPSYVINMIKNSFDGKTHFTNELVTYPYNHTFDLKHYHHAIANILILKKDIAKESTQLIDLL